MGIEIKKLKEVDGDEEATYLRFNRLPVAKSETFANGEVNLDLDAYDNVVGIELLSSGPEVLEALADIVRKYALSLDALKYAKR